jgi:hypothetical protein
MKLASILAALVVAFTLSVPAIPAADAKKKSAEKPAETAKKEEPKSDAKKDHYPLYGRVVSITETTLTIKGGEGKEDRKFDITKETVIKKDDKAATVKDTKEGQWVGGYVKRSGGKGNDQIVSLNLSAKQKEAKADEKKSETPAPKKKK